jgi:hypothetical protein
MTGRIPVSVSCISRAAERVELDGRQHTGFLVIISLTFMTTSRMRLGEQFSLICYANNSERVFGETQSDCAALSAFQAAPRKTIITENSIHTINPIAAATPP